jgi:hypothetical protein
MYVPSVYSSAPLLTPQRAARRVAHVCAGDRPAGQVCAHVRPLVAVPRLVNEVGYVGPAMVVFGRPVANQAKTGHERILPAMSAPRPDDAAQISSPA